jgi:hypothetical protein
MADEQQTIAQPELATPAPEATVTEPTIVDEPERILSPEEAHSEQQAAEAASVAAELETVEIEWDDGKKYVIPKPLESGILKNKDYTTKTQEAAALRKQLESREVEINQRLEATEQELDARAELRGISAQLADYAKLTAEDWQYHLQQDPLGTQQARMQFEMLKDRKAELDGVLSKTTAERSEKAQQALAKRVQDTLAEAPKIIPGWTPETANKTMDELLSYATSEGIPEQVLKDNWSPQLLKLLHRAHLGHNLLTKQATAPKPAPTVVPQPLQTVAGKSSAPASGDLASLDMEAYVAARKKGVGGKPLR